MYLYIFFILGKLCDWFIKHRGISIFYEALQKSFPNHNIVCKLLCTTQDCIEYQYVHTDNRKWTCRFVNDPKHICITRGKSVCEKETDNVITTRDMCPFSVFLAVEKYTSLLLGTGFEFQSNPESCQILDPFVHKININNAILISGSTAHAGVPFPKQLQRSSRLIKRKPKLHYRIFFEGDPKGAFTSDLLNPQYKFSMSVLDNF